MFDVKKLNATPGLARRLLQVSQINKMHFSDDLVDLAMQDLVSKADLEKFGCLLNNSEIAALQHVKDWQGRAMVLTPDYETGRKIAMAHLVTSDGRSLILADPKRYVFWVRQIQQFLPDKKISVFGNPRYKESGWPADIEFSDKPDLTADIFVTSYGGMIFSNLLTQTVINQTVVEELDHQTVVNYKWQDSLTGIFHEVPAPLFLQNIQSLPRNPEYDIHTSLQISGSKAMQFISEIITNYMWAGVGHMMINNLISVGRQESSGYLTAHGYRATFQQYLTLMGITSELINQQDATNPLVFRDETIKLLRNTKRPNKDSGIHRIYLREGELEAQTGHTMRELVQSALDGDRPLQSVLGALQNNQWATLKVACIKAVHQSFTHRGTRTLFLTDNADMLRALNMSFSVSMWRLANNHLMNAARFTQGIFSDYMDQLTWQEQAQIKPMNNLIITPAELQANPLLLKAADFVVMTQLVQSSKDAQALIHDITVAGAKLVIPYLDGTFESHFFDLMPKKNS